MKDRYYQEMREGAMDRAERVVGEPSKPGPPGNSALSEREETTPLSSVKEYKY